MITTITILGVVSVVALPIINNVSDNSTRRKFEMYEESLLSAAKLYVDQSEADLFGDADDGCASIGFSEVTDKDLIKDIDVENATCASPNTFVKVTKKGSVYDYDVSIECAIDSKVVYANIKERDDSCLAIGDFDKYTTGFWNYKPNPVPPSMYIATPSTIYSDPKENGTPAKKRTVTILVSNEKGFAPNVKVRYYWINADTNAVVGDKVEKDFKNALVKTSVTFRHDVTTPNVSANLKLVVEPVNVICSNGFQIVDKYTSGVFKIDNTAPTVVIKAFAYENNKVGNLVKQANNSDLSITDWKKHGYYFDFSSSYDNYGIIKQTWKWNKSDSAVLDKSLTGGPTVDNKITNKTFTGLGARYGTVEMCDKANNCTTRGVQVNMSTKFTIKYDPNGGTGSANNTTCYYGFDCSLAKPNYKKTDYDFVGWSINGKEYDPTGSVKNLSTKNNDTLTAKARWKLKAYNVTLKGNGISDLNTVQKIHGKDLTLPTPSRNGYTFLGWNSSSTSHDKGYGTTYKENKAITLYAIWKKNDPLKIIYKPDKAKWFSDFDDKSRCYLYNTETSCEVTVTSVPQCNDWSGVGYPDQYQYKKLFDHRGWHTSTGQTNAQYKNGDKIKLTNNLNLYAVVVLNSDHKRMVVRDCTYYDDNGYHHHQGLTMKSVAGGDSSTKVYVMREGATFEAAGRLSWEYVGGNVWLKGHMARVACWVDTNDWPVKGVDGWGYTLLDGRTKYANCLCHLGSSNWNTSGYDDCYSHDNWSTAQWMRPA